jgi:uncharacterized OB-fold protein
VEWIELPGQGKLAAFTIISVPTTALTAEGYDRAHPYCVGIVVLADGLRASARILGVDVDHPDSIRIGQPLTVEFLRPEGDPAGRVTLAFRAVQE